MVWEIPSLDRDKVTGLNLLQLPKMFPDPGDQTIFYLDQLELQKVDADHVEGWDVAAGKIAFSHAGYRRGRRRRRWPAGLLRRIFRDGRRNGRSRLTKRWSRENDLGNSRCWIFLNCNVLGNIFARAKQRRGPFGSDRCLARQHLEGHQLHVQRAVRHGDSGNPRHLPQDDYTVHGDQRIVVNGGYHDAGDLSATGNTPGMTYALLTLAERLQEQGDDPELRAG